MATLCLKTTQVRSSRTHSHRRSIGKLVGVVVMEPYGAEEKQQPCCRVSSKKRSNGKQGSAMGVRGDGDGDGKSRRPSFSGRCARLVKEQRARFYIMRRCVTMLVCWRDYA